MNNDFIFDPSSNQLRGPAGSLSIDPSDVMTCRYLMLQEGLCLNTNVSAVAKKYGYCRQRFYQLLDRFKKGGMAALETQKTGPKAKSRRTDQAVRQVLRQRFLDPDSSVDVIAQKLNQTLFPMSVRSVNRVIADYGLQKKTLRLQSQKGGSSPSGSKHSKKGASGPGRSAKP